MLGSSTGELPCVIQVPVAPVRHKAGNGAPKAASLAGVRVGALLADDNMRPAVRSYLHQQHHSVHLALWPCASPKSTLAAMFLAAEGAHYVVFACALPDATSPAPQASSPHHGSVACAPGGEVVSFLGAEDEGTMYVAMAVVRHYGCSAGSCAAAVGRGDSERLRGAPVHSQHSGDPHTLSLNGAQHRYVDVNPSAVVQAGLEFDYSGRDSAAHLVRVVPAQVPEHP